MATEIHATRRSLLLGESKRHTHDTCQAAGAGSSPKTHIPHSMTNLSRASAHQHIQIGPTRLISIVPWAQTQRSRPANKCVIGLNGLVFNFRWPWILRCPIIIITILNFSKFKWFRKHPLSSDFVWTKQAANRHSQNRIRETEILRRWRTNAKPLEVVYIILIHIFSSLLTFFFPPSTDEFGLCVRCARATNYNVLCVQSWH